MLQRHGSRLVGLQVLVSALLLALSQSTLSRTAAVELAPIDAADALWRGMEKSRLAQQRLNRKRDKGANADRERYAQVQWQAARSLFETGLELFEASQPSLPWDPAGSPGPQLLLEAARSLYYLNQPQAALVKLTQLETVLPAGNDAQLQGVVQQWAFRSHAAASDYAGASSRLRRLLSLYGVKQLESVRAMELRYAWRQLSLPPDSQLQAAEALSRDASSTHPRAAVRIWQLLQESSLLPWSAVRRRARGGDIATAGREHWILFITSLHRCTGLPGMSLAAQQHRQACNELLVRHWRELRRFGSWVHPAQFPMAFDPSLLPEPSAVGRQIGWLNSSDVELRPCKILQKYAPVIRREWAAFVAKSPRSSTGQDDNNFLLNHSHTQKHEDLWPQLSAFHADSHLSADHRWEMLYLRRGNGSGGFLSPVCGADAEGGIVADAPFRKTCAILSKLEEVSWALQRYYPCGATGTTDATGRSVSSPASSLCVPPGTPNFFDSPGPVAFLRLKRGGSVPPHVGTTNLRMKCHLALEVPRHESTPRIGNDMLQYRGAWVEVGGSKSFHALVPTPEEAWENVHHAHQHHVGRKDAGIVIWRAPGQVEAFDDSFVHAVGNDVNRYTLPENVESTGGGGGGGGYHRTVLEVSFWHPMLRNEGWLLPTSWIERRELIRTSGQLGAAARSTTETAGVEGDTSLQDSASSQSIGNRYDGRFVRIEVHYNGVWNRGLITKVHEPPKEIKPDQSKAGAADEDSSTTILVFVEYDRSQAKQQCSNEWLVLDCELMQWSQPGFGGGGFRIRPQNT